MPKGIKGFQKGQDMPWLKGKRLTKRQFSEQAIENIRQAALKERAIPNGKLFHKGSVIMPEHREALNEAIRTKRRSYAGIGNPNFGKEHSEETLQKISASVLASDTLERRERMSQAAKDYDFSGARNGNWKGGRWSLGIGYPSSFNHIKDTIRERDGYMCQMCGIPQVLCCQLANKALDVHHRDGNHFNTEPDNLITLCRSCHKIADAKLKAGKEMILV